MKRYLVCLAVVFGAALPGQAYDRDSNTEPRDAISSVAVRLQATIPDELLTNLPDEAFDLALSEGWTRTSSGFEKIYTGSGLLIEVNGMLAETNDDGTFVMSCPIDVSSSLHLEFNGEAIDARPLRVLYRDDGSVSIEMLRNLADMTCCFGKEFNNPTPMTHFTCRDYNGAWGDCVNYVHWDPRAYWNFIDSDCAYGYWTAGCWNDNTDHPYCNSSYRNCSWVIGHSYKHHCH